MLKSFGESRHEHLSISIAVKHFSCQVFETEEIWLASRDLSGFSNPVEMGGPKHHPLGLTCGQAACMIALGAPLVLPETQTYPDQALIFCH